MTIKQKIRLISICSWLDQLWSIGIVLVSFVIWNLCVHVKSPKENIAHTTQMHNSKLEHTKERKNQQNWINCKFGSQISIRCVRQSARTYFRGSRKEKTRTQMCSSKTPRNRSSTSKYLWFIYNNIFQVNLSTSFCVLNTFIYFKKLVQFKNTAQTKKKNTHQFSAFNV